MSDEHPQHVLERAFTFFGGVGGFASIALIIWKGGILWQMVTDHDRRLVDIEHGGSIGLREHVKLDDERVREIQVQQAIDREIRQRLLETVAVVSSDVKVLGVKMDAIKEQLPSKKQP